jgi:hypothetical protein
VAVDEKWIKRRLAGSRSRHLSDHHHMNDSSSISRLCRPQNEENNVKKIFV